MCEQCSLCVCRWCARGYFLLLLLASAAAGEETLAARVPRPEHPFPQMVRAEWLNLNGTWEFAETDDANDAPWLSGKPYPDKIVVPFCRESKLSGLARTGFVKNVWYRRTFQKPADWKSDRVRLHVGACDWKTRVWVNGQLVGEHTGGSAPFCFDVTDRLKPGDNTVVIHAFDDTRSGLQATGKQAHSEKSQGCVYTRTTGIWQTVWLEGVGSTFLSDVRIEPDLKQSRVILQAEIDGPCDGLTLKAVALAGGKEVGTAETPADWRNNRLVLNLSEKRLWSVEDPFLYDLKLVLLRDGQLVDQVDSYFGLREVTIRGAAILINGKPVFQRTGPRPGLLSGGHLDRAERRGAAQRHQALAGRGLQRGAAAPEGLRAAVSLLGRQARIPGLGRVSQLGPGLQESGRQSAGGQRMDGDRPPRPQPSRRSSAGARSTRRRARPARFRKRSSTSPGRSIPRGR